ncbi:MAG: hypothetical protein LAO04_00860 [Acidobacteriia bacterium]|nr:hypothetical protein [Terriglobia bacterium]
MFINLTFRMFVTVMLVYAGIAWSLPAPQAIANKKELRSALKTARTPEDHQRIAAYFQEEAKNLREKAKQEQDLANYYLEHANNYPKKYPTPYQNANQLADYYQWASDQALAKAAKHLEQAKEAERSTQK